MSSTSVATTPVTPGSPQVPGGPNYTPASLYVGDLKPDVGEALLFDIFNTVGPVASIRVCRDVITRRSLGYAYVNFHSVADAERAHDTMNFQPIRGHPCRIMWSQRDPSLRKSGVGNIFVKNLDKTIDHKTLYDTFSMFGNILSCKVAMNDKGESLGYGFVHYETLDSAQKAIEKVNGMVIAGREVHVAPFRSKSQRSGPDKTTFTNVYVKSFPPEMDSKEKFEALMTEYGEITSVNLPIDEITGKPKGFGFVNFKEPQDAARAVQEISARGDGMYAGRAQKKDERERELRQRFDALRIEQAEKYHGVNLYIKNLDDTIDDDQLKNEFKEFGEITSAKVMRDSNGRSKGFGFVCFTTKEEAAKCVSEMNGRVMCGKPLYVTTAQRKEIRRQQLEQQAQVNRNKLAAGLPPPMPYPPGMYYQQPTGPGQMPRPAPGFMYTQQMMAQQRWNPRQAQSPHMIAMPPRPAQQPMPNLYMNNLAMQQQYQQQQQQQARGMAPGGGVARGGARGGPGGGGGRGSVMKPQPRQPGPSGPGPAGGVGPGGVPMGQQPQESRIKFAPNVRNQPVTGVTGVAGQPVVNGAPMGAGGQQASGDGAQPQQPTGPPGPLTSQALARAPTQQQKQMIGERIFPLIQERQPDLAGKITGMLLEMDNTELLHLLENRDALNDKISEALAVLEQHQHEGTQKVQPNAPADPQAA